MRLSIIALLASAAIVSATGCAQNNMADLVARVSCGRSKPIAQCLRADVDLTKLDEIERCLIAGGCSAADARAETEWFAYDCRASDVDREDLKRRQKDDESSTADD